MAGQGGGAGGQEGGDKNTYYILWIIVLVAVIGGLIWYFFDIELKAFFIAVKKYELIAIYAVLAFLPYAWIQQYFPGFPDLSQQVANDLLLVRRITPQNITVEVAEVLSTEVGEYLQYPVAILLAFLAYYVYRHHPLMRFTQRYNTRALAQQETENWPQIKIVSRLDLLAQDLDSGPWAMAMTPIQFAKKNKLIAIEFADRTETQFSKTEMPEFKILLDKMRAERAFTAQLGRPWQGVEKMAAHRRAIFAVFAARVCRDSKAALDLVYQLAGSAGEGRLDYSGVDSLLKKYAKDSRVVKIYEKHAYEFTVMASMLLAAREDGVVASADFLWVKPMDRRLWYVINNVGRQTPTVEVAGIFCHWYNEMALKKPLSVPVVDNAVVALEFALSEIFYIPDDKEREEIEKRLKEKQETKEEHSDEEESSSHMDTGVGV